MAQIYDILGKRYGLSEKYKVLTSEEEIKQISIYQNPKTPVSIKKQIVEEFWNNHKSAIIKEVIKYYGSYYSKTSGSVTLELDDLVQKGAMALTHCLNIYDIISAKKALLSKKTSKQTNKPVKFGTLLHWWLRPFIMQKINQENYMIYVPHYKGSTHKSILVDSMDKKISNKSDKTKVEYVKSADQSPTEFTETNLFWDRVKELLSPIEFEMLIHWLSYKKYFNSAKQLYEKYNLTPSKFKTKIKEILNKLKVNKKDFE